jgi:hypothetical protein
MFCWCHITRNDQHRCNLVFPFFFSFFRSFLCRGDQEDLIGNSCWNFGDYKGTSSNFVLCACVYTDWLSYHWLFIWAVCSKSWCRLPVYILLSNLGLLCMAGVSTLQIWSRIVSWNCYYIISFDQNTHIFHATGLCLLELIRGSLDKYRNLILLPGTISEWVALWYWLCFVSIG